MIFSLYENIELISPKEKDILLLRVKSELAYTETFGLFIFNRYSNKKYEGFVGMDNFKLRRIQKIGRNSFIPTVEGKITVTDKGSNIKLKIRLHRFVYIFLVFCILFSMSMFSFKLPNSILPFALYIIPLVIYVYESRNVKNDLKAILNAQSL